MTDLSVIVRRVLRRRIKSGEGLERVVGELLGDDWMKMLSSNRNDREGVVSKIANEIRQRLRDTSFVETGFRNGDTSIDLNRQTVVAHG